MIDSAGVVKLAWHAIRRALAPCALAVRAAAGQAVICLIVRGTNDQVGAMTGKLGNLPGVQVKSALVQSRSNPI